eukprot:1141598-Pelagomonas_calceolata.AAC.1
MAKLQKDFPELLLAFNQALPPGECACAQGGGAKTFGSHAGRMQLKRKVYASQEAACKRKEKEKKSLHSLEAACIKERFPD